MVCIRWAYPGKSYLDNGIIAGAGSDVSVTPISPWWGIFAAVVRRGLISGQIMAPEERLTVAEALQLYTRNGAYIGFEENQKRSLEPGKLADFIVIDRDVLTVPGISLRMCRYCRRLSAANFNTRNLSPRNDLVSLQCPFQTPSRRVLKLLSTVQSVSRITLTGN
jgi:cytosine/adenosine deaminase-related metal-dependent hydrolase